MALQMREPLRECVCGLEAWREKDLEMFTKDPSSSHGRNSICKKCASERVKKRYRSDPKIRRKRSESSRKWNLANPERVKIIRKRNSWKTMGVDPEKARIIYDSTNICAICGIEVNGRYKHLDHNHKTKEIRGVLCHTCNVMIGMSREDIKILEKAIEYLSIHS